MLNALLSTALLVHPLLSPGPQEAVRFRERPGFPLITAARVYVGTQSGTLWALDRSSGHELWRFETGAPLFNRPVLEDGRLYVGGQDGKLRAFDADTGEVQWEFECGRVAWGFRDRFVNGAVTLLEGMVLFSSEDFNVYALDAENGEEFWRCRLGEEPQAFELPVVDGLALVGAWDGILYAIDVGLGEIRWRSETDRDLRGQTLRDAEGELYWKPDDSEGELLAGQAPYVTVVPVVSDDSIYFTDWAGSLMAVERETGKQRWRFKAKTKPLRHVGSRFHLVLQGDVLVFGTQEDGHLYGIDRKSGHELWKLDRGAPVYGPFDGGEGVLLVLEESAGEHGFALVALDLATQKVLWSRADAAGFPVVSDGKVHFATMSGTFEEVEPRSGEVLWRMGD